MSEVISKELLSEVLGYKVTNISHNGKPITMIHINPTQRRDKPSSCVVSKEIINIYELAHKCKEWARTQDYYIQTGNRLDGTTRYDVLSARIDIDFEDYDDSEIFSEVYDTEPVAIFKACEWILKESK